jgi:hypothetical protein
MRTPQKRAVGTANYEVTPLGALEGSRVFARLLSIAGPVVETIAKAGPKGDAAGAAVFAALTQRITPEDLTFFCEVFARWTTVNINGKEPRLSDIFDEHFSGNYGDMLQWLSFCIEVNFGSFFGGSSLANVGAALGKAT